MPRVRDAMQEEYDDAIHDGKLPERLPYNPAQPWEGVFQRVTFEETEWWNEQYNEPCFYITCKASHLDYHLAGDSAVASSRTLPAASSLLPDVPSHPTTRENLPLRKRTSPAPRRAATTTKTAARGGFPDVDDNGWYLYNRNNQELCRMCQRGECAKAAAGNRCPKDKSRIHQCGICLKVGHGAAQCKNTQATGAKSRRKQ